LQRELTTLIGGDNVLRAEWRNVSAPADDQIRIGAFEITDAGWEILTTGIAGPQGFEEVTGAGVDGGS
jgi:nicotinamide mononucleotide (NMN) deamidase PncC